MKSAWILGPLAAGALAVGALAVGAAHAETSDKAVELPFYVDDGEVHTVRYDFTKEKNQSGKVTSITAQIVGKIEIKSVGDETFDADWTTISVAMKDGSQVIQGADSRDLLIGVPISYTARADGAPIKVDNAAQLIENILSDDGPLGNLDKKSREQTASFFQQMSSPALAQVLLKAPTYMSVCQSTNLEVGKRVEYDDELPNPFGGAALAARGSYLLSAASNEPSEARIEWNQKLDPVAAKKFVTEILKRVAPEKSKGKDIEKELKKASLDISNEANCVIDRETGWVSSMRYSKKASFGDSGSSEVYEISVE